MDVSALKESDGLHELLVLNTQELGGFGGVETLGNLMQLAKCGQRGSTSQRGQRNFSGFRISGNCRVLKGCEIK